MTKGAYYNEVDPHAAEWLRSLIRMGLIAAGDVDDRSIVDVAPDDIKGYTQCHFFAGIGVWSLALRTALWPDDKPVWTGSCPCQPFSVGGQKKAMNDPRHLWPSWFRLIEERKPHVIFGEQVASRESIGPFTKQTVLHAHDKSTWAWLDHVSGDLEAAHYAIGSAAFPACSVGSPQLRQRLYFVAERLSVPTDAGFQGWCGTLCEEVRANGQADAFGPTGHIRPLYGFWSAADWIGYSDGSRRPIEPRVKPLVDGSSKGMGHGDINNTLDKSTARLKAYGNAIVPQQAAVFIRSYMDASIF